MSEAMGVMLEEACRVSNSSKVGFMRRAIAVQIARVLGISLLGLLGTNPAMREYQDKQTGKSLGPDRGDGIEQWCPHPGCDGAHLLA